MTETNSLPSTNRPPSALKLIIGPSSTTAAGGTVHLNVGELNLIAGTFQGDYRINVVPYAFKNEKGKLTIEAPNDSLRKLTNQMAVDFVGKAIDTDAAMRRIDGTITPTSHNKGTVLLWFVSGKKKMTFQTTYRLETR